LVLPHEVAADAHELVRPGVRKGPEHHRVENAEHRDARADAERQDARDGRGKAAIASQAAESEADVADEIFEWRQDLDVAALLAQRQSIAKAASGFALGFCARQALTHEVLDARFDVVLLLRVEIAIQAPVPEHVREP
jgi:hypothetical protein